LPHLIKDNLQLSCVDHSTLVEILICNTNSSANSLDENWVEMTDPVKIKHACKHHSCEYASQEDLGGGIVPNEDGEKNEVVDDTFKVVIKGKGVFDVTEFQVEVFRHEQQVQVINVIDSRLKRCT
jgi:hypothetical protein